MELGELILLVFCKQVLTTFLMAPCRFINPSIHQKTAKQCSVPSSHPHCCSSRLLYSFPFIVVIFSRTENVFFFLLFFTLLFIAKKSEPLLCL